MAGERTCWSERESPRRADFRVAGVSGAEQRWVPVFSTNEAGRSSARPVPEIPRPISCKAGASQLSDPEAGKVDGSRCGDSDRPD